MTRLDRETLTRFLGMLAMCMGSLVVVFISIDYVGRVGFWQTAGVEAARRYYLAATAHFMWLAGPIATLLAAMFTVTGMVRRRELMATRAAGRSFGRAMLPIWLAGLAWSGAWFVLADTWLPEANRTRVAIQEPRGREAFESSPNRTDHLAPDPAGGATLFFRRWRGLEHRGEQGIAVLWDTQSRTRTLVVAPELFWTADSGWTTPLGSVRVWDSAGRLVRWNDSLPLRVLEARLRPEDLSLPRVLPDELDRAALDQRIDLLRRRGEPTHAWETERAARDATPWTSAVIVYIGTCLAGLVSSAGVAPAFGAGVFLAFAYYVLIRACLALGHADSLDPQWAAWTPNVVFMLVGLMLWLRARR